MQRTIGRLWLVMVLLVSLLATSGAMAQTGTRVVLAPASALVGEGQTAAVEVRVENVQDLYGLDIRIGFDPAVVEVVDADATQAGVQVRPGDLLSVDFVIRNTADNAQGTIWYALTQLNPSQPVSGSGVAFVIVFKGKQRGATSALTVTYQKMATRTGEAIPADVANGEIQVVEPSQAPATPTPAPPPPQPTVPLPTPTPEATLPAQPTQAKPTAQPTAAPTQPAPTARPSDTPMPTAPAQPTPAPTATGAPTLAPTAAPTAYAEPTAAQPTADASGAGSGGSLNLGLVLVSMVGVVILLGGGWALWQRQRRRGN